MSDPILSQANRDGTGENDDFFNEFDHNVNKESSPDGRNLCLTDPNQLEKTVLVHNANEVSRQEQQQYYLLNVSSPVQPLILLLDDGSGRHSVNLQLPEVIPQAEADQPLVNTSGGNVEPLRCETAPSADPSEIPNEELEATAEVASSSGHPSVRTEKKHLWQYTEPFDDPKMEKRRQEAIKQRNIRVKKNGEIGKKNDEIAALKRKLEEKDKELTMVKKANKDALGENQILKELLQAALNGRPNQY